jgi:hypothetical protein
VEWQERLALITVVVEVVKLLEDLVSTVEAAAVAITLQPRLLVEQVLMAAMAVLAVLTELVEQREHNQEEAVGRLKLVGPQVQALMVASM